MSYRTPTPNEPIGARPHGHGFGTLRISLAPSPSKLGGEVRSKLRETVIGLGKKVCERGRSQPHPSVGDVSLDRIFCPEGATTAAEEIKAFLGIVERQQTLLGVENATEWIAKYFKPTNPEVWEELARIGGEIGDYERELARIGGEIGDYERERAGVAAIGAPINRRGRSPARQEGDGGALATERLAHLRDLQTRLHRAMRERGAESGQPTPEQLNWFNSVLETEKDHAESGFVSRVFKKTAGVVRGVRTALGHIIGCRFRSLLYQVVNATPLGALSGFGDKFMRYCRRTDVRFDTHDATYMAVAAGTLATICYGMYWINPEAVFTILGLDDQTGSGLWGASQQVARTVGHRAVAVRSFVGRLLPRSLYTLPFELAKELYAVVVRIGLWGLNAKCGISADMAATEAATEALNYACEGRHWLQWVQSGLYYADSKDDIDRCRDRMFRVWQYGQYATALVNPIQTAVGSLAVEGARYTDAGWIDLGRLAHAVFSVRCLSLLFNFKNVSSVGGTIRDLLEMTIKLGSTAIRRSLGTAQTPQMIPPVDVKDKRAIEIDILRAQTFDRSAGEQRPLPGGWVTAMVRDGRRYYVNSREDRVQWDLPVVATPNFSY